VDNFKDILLLAKCKYLWYFYPIKQLLMEASMKENTIIKENIDETLFKFLQSIYLFEKREARIFGTTWDEVYLLQLLLRQPGIQVSSLATSLKTPDFVTSRMITKLGRLGFVRRESSTQDKRVVNVYITESGQAKVKEIEQYNFDTITSQFDVISQEEVRVLMSSIERLGDFLGLDK